MSCHLGAGLFSGEQRLLVSETDLIKNSSFVKQLVDLNNKKNVTSITTS